MSKQPTVSVRMNGEKTDMFSNQEDESFTAYQEQAATVEQRFRPEDLVEYEKNDDIDDDWYVEKYRKRKLPPGFKVFAFAALAAIIVGVILGFVSLRMFAGIDDNQMQLAQSVQTLPTDGNGSATTDGQASDAANSGNNSNAVQVPLEPLSAVVIQGGVFSSHAKAEEWQRQFNDAGYPTMIWETADGQYRLFAGLFSSEQAADLTVADMGADGLEAYVRPWQPEVSTAEIAPSEQEWLETFTAQWQQAMEVLQSEGTLSNEQGGWEDWLSSYPETASTQTESLQLSGQQLVENIGSEQSSATLQMDLLQLWQHYVALGHN
ncbi:SPOR domain-containing protein [Aquibacillus sediminis]|uniref:SPOR domain-containing protein n=1 Tax=Aquibacillus sediminis TaxID=2574734 RepID=UPI00110839DC|nr:SPOR domain-containing protein [Aquibacillus sediminis]